MSATVNRRGDGTLVSIDVRCDTCGKTETDEAIIAGGGLLNMGWRRVFDLGAREYRHTCPDHHSEEETRGN